MSSATPNPTMQSFGWPDTTIAELEHWVVALRPAQPTLGSLVVICKQPVQAFSDVDQAGFAEFGLVVHAVERMLRRVVDYDKINWLMLMMVDPDVHFHAIPRHADPRMIAGLEKADAGWPGPPAVGEAVTPDDKVAGELLRDLKEAWSL